MAFWIEILPGFRYDLHLEMDTDQILPDFFCGDLALFGGLALALIVGPVGEYFYM